jgi:hypothetical protein
MINKGIVWIIEFRRQPSDPWELQSAHETLKDAKEDGWEAVAPAVQRIRKYVRVEKGTK